MSTNPVWIAGYGGPVAGAAPVWIAGYGGPVTGASEAWIAGYGGTPIGGASPVWIAGYGGAPTGGASPIWIGGTIESGGGPSYSAQTIAYLARTVGGNEGGNAANIAALIDGLVADGVWAKLDALYVLAQQNITDAKLNLVSTNYNATVATAGTWTTYRGATAFSWDTGFNPITATSPHYTQNAASFGVWSSGTPTEFIPEMGNDAAATSSIFTNYSGNLFYARVNNASIASVPSPGTSALYVGDRESSAGVDPFINGVDKGFLAGVSGAPVSGNFLIGNAPTGTVTAQTIAAAYIGGSLGATLQLALYTRLRTYMTAVGVP